MSDSDSLRAEVEGFQAAVGRLREEMGRVIVGQREVILYFAEHCDEFSDSVEWYHRYKAIETFYEDMASELGLPSNQIKGLYDENDIDPDQLNQIADRPPPSPVDWSRDEHQMY